MDRATPQPQSSFAPWEDPEAQPIIRFEGVSKKFGDFTAIQPLDLAIYRREFFALLGPSGCGKTTLMRMLAGFETPSSGQVYLDGQDITALPPNRRPVNMMFQSYALFPHLSVWENIAFGLRRDGMAKDQIAERVAEMLRLTRLEAQAKRKPDALSGGQRQRVALARSLARAPKVLLLDEPLGALDKKLRQETQFELMDIQERTGTTFVVVTHDQEEAMTMASRIAVMGEGVIRQIDTPGGIYEAPNSVYVAEFIGDVNIFRGRAEAGASEASGDQAASNLRLHWHEEAAPLVAEGGAGIAKGGEMALAVRPEKVGISHDKPDMANAIPGQVIDIAYLGHLSTYHVQVAGGQIVKAQIANAGRVANRAITWDDQVWLGFGEDAGVILAG